MKLTVESYMKNQTAKTSLYMNVSLAVLSLTIAWQPLTALATSHKISAQKFHAKKSKQRRFLAQANLKQANDIFFAKVRTVAKGFENYAKTNGKFPEFFGYGGGQMVYVLQDSLSGNLDNPYYADRINLVPDGKLRDQMSSEVDFRFFPDDKLNDDRIEIYKTNPPSDWLGEPGIIAGVGSKDETMILFFGVGSDGKPLRENTSDGSLGAVRFALARRNK